VFTPFFFVLLALHLLSIKLLSMSLFPREQDVRQYDIAITTYDMIKSKELKSTLSRTYWRYVRPSLFSIAFRLVAGRLLPHPLCFPPPPAPFSLIFSCLLFFSPPPFPLSLSIISFPPNHPTSSTPRGTIYTAASCWMRGTSSRTRTLRSPSRSEGSTTSTPSSSLVLRCRIISTSSGPY